MTVAFGSCVKQDSNESNGNTDQFWPWSAFTVDGKLAVDYDDRKYGKGRDDRVLGLQPVRNQRSEALRADPAHVQLDAAAAVRRHGGREGPRCEGAERPATVSGRGFTPRSHVRVTLVAGATFVRGPKPECAPASTR